jgi:hypothetical protein
MNSIERLHLLCQQSLLQVMQPMQVLQIQLANWISPPDIIHTRAQNHVQNSDFLEFSVKICYT